MRRGKRSETTSAGATGNGRQHKPLDAAQAKRLIGVGKAVAPLLAPYAMAAAGAARGRWDAYRASRLGVPITQLSSFTGPGGALQARISRIAEAMAELESGAGGKPTPAAREFVAKERPRLADLAVAVRAAEQMPTPRRRGAYRSISTDLDRVETELLTHLGVST